MCWIKRFFFYVITWRKHREAVKQLNQLSDQQLNDIGLTRGDIDDIIWLAADKEVRGAYESRTEFLERQLAEQQYANSLLREQLMEKTNVSST